ncbi:hypothetical protein [Anaeromicropila populeti]|uniref:Uncharacterized membrane protein n=1 Tax=Anaeromicropila populeti TaxID=37658 RepID=A0A1I6KGP3_9FIRM|nr:hypothetical protein [Anaeromicropila populeti]SFR90411.1 Uncharacterized membrane protein [Anaeromicropila populeti]
MPQFTNNKGPFEQVKDGFEKTSDHTSEYDPQDIEKNKVVCGLCYLGVLFFLPLIVCPDSKFGRFHANQALILLIFSVIISLTEFVWIVGGIFHGVLGLICAVFVIVGLVNAIQGKAKDLPVIGSIKLIK